MADYLINEDRGVVLNLKPQRAQVDEKSSYTIFGFKHCFCWNLALPHLHKDLCSQELQQSGFGVAHFRPHSWKSLMDSSELSSGRLHSPFFSNCGLLTNGACSHFLHKECFRGIPAQGKLSYKKKKQKKPFLLPEFVNVYGEDICLLDLYTCTMYYVVMKVANFPFPKMILI